jgi:hypothetical protein
VWRPANSRQGRSSQDTYATLGSNRVGDERQVLWPLRVGEPCRRIEMEACAHLLGPGRAAGPA